METSWCLLQDFDSQSGVRSARPLCPLPGCCVFVAVTDYSCHVGGWHVGSTSQSVSRLGTWKTSNLWPSGASEETVAEAEFLLWHSPAADIVFQLLHQTGDSLQKSKTAPLRLLHHFEAEASVAVRLVGRCEQDLQLSYGSSLKTLQFVFLRSLLSDHGEFRQSAQQQQGVFQPEHFNKADTLCVSVLGMNNVLQAGVKHG